MCVLAISRRRWSMPSGVSTSISASMIPTAFRRVLTLWRERIWRQISLRMPNATSCAGLNMPSVPAIHRVRQCCLGWLPKFIINLAITASRSIMPTVPTALILSEGARRRWQCDCRRRAPRLSV